MDQKLANHLRHKEYKEALQISLQRDKPRHALRVFTAMIEAEVQKGNDGLEPLQLHVTSWDEDTLLRVLQYCRDWNTNARNCHVALLVIKAITASIPIHTLAATKGVPEIIAGIMSYAERHFDRLDKLYGNSFLLDFALSSMGDLEASNDEGWEARSKLVLPPKQVDGRIQVGGMAIVGRRGTSGEDDDDEVLTMGDSDTSDDEDVSPLKAGDSAVTPISEESESSDSESD
jgi:U3 small nucleolar RNA-associated protein 13